MKDARTFGGKMPETLLGRKGAGNPPLEERCRKARLGVKKVADMANDFDLRLSDIEMAGK